MGIVSTTARACVAVSNFVANNPNYAEALEDVILVKFLRRVPLHTSLSIFQCMKVLDQQNSVAPPAGLDFGVSSP